MTVRYSLLTGLLIISVLSIVAFTGWGRSDDETVAEIPVAVASNFTDPIRIIAQEFEKKTGYDIILAFGSTGRHYAQITNGAPFDIFMAADSYRPQLLEKEGYAIAGSRFTYAIGRLVLWSPRDGFIDTSGRILGRVKDGYVAMANPKLAPYGMAAREVLQALGYWDNLQGRLVRGENIGQAYQFVQSGNAGLGFVAASQVMRPDKPQTGSYWIIPQELYSPIEQQAVLLNNTPEARAFIKYLKSPEARNIIHAWGYETPEHK